MEFRFEVAPSGPQILESESIIEPPLWKARPLGSTPKRSPHLLSRSLRGLLDNMLVAGGHPGIGVTEQAHGHSGWDALDEQKRRRGVTGIVKTALAHTGEPKYAVPFSRVGLLADRAAVFAGEDEPEVLPAAPSSQPFSRLSC